MRFRNRNVYQRGLLSGKCLEWPDPWSVRSGLRLLRILEMDESEVVISLLSLPMTLCRLGRLESALGYSKANEEDDHGRYS